MQNETYLGRGGGGTDSVIQPSCQVQPYNLIYMVSLYLYTVLNVLSKKIYILECNIMSWQKGTNFSEKPGESIFKVKKKTAWENEGKYIVAYKPVTR
jgi:hypothetical protein